MFVLLPVVISTATWRFLPRISTVCMDAKVSELLLNRDRSLRQCMKCLGLFIYLPTTFFIYLLIIFTSINGLSVEVRVASNYRITETENRKGCEGKVVVLSQVISQFSPGGSEESYASSVSE